MRNRRRYRIPDSCLLPLTSSKTPDWRFPPGLQLADNPSEMRRPDVIGVPCTSTITLFARMSRTTCFLRSCPEVALGRSEVPDGPTISYILSQNCRHLPPPRVKCKFHPGSPDTNHKTCPTDIKNWQTKLVDTVHFFPHLNRLIAALLAPCK